MNKTLVAYFSASGETARLAQNLAEAAHADLFAIEPAQPYTAADLNWNSAASRSSVEMNDPASRPAIASRADDMARYDVVLIGFPIWWYQAPRIIETFLEAYDFSGKTVVPFATSGGSGMGKTEAILKAACSAQTRWKPGMVFSSRAGVGTLRDWLNSLKLNG
ncbi:MAG: flavodoxin [Clostridia bacterium]|nr:flavodoxin [Clostridia bacterium]